MDIYQGGCSCQQVRFELDSHPAWVLACHCNECKKRTGSDYGVSAVTKSDDVSMFTGEVSTYLRQGDDGTDVVYEFCPNCGTTVRWRVAAIPGKEVFAAGAFDDIASLPIAGEMYTEFKAPWVQLGCELSTPLSPDDPFRMALIEKSKSLRS